MTNTLIGIQDKQIAAELKAYAKHGNTSTAKAVIFAARTRAKNALMNLGFSFLQAREAVTDAADMVALERNAQ